ncbi:hypothetical protein GCM10025787_23560 [Saccharopolyspora rosea]
MRGCTVGVTAERKADEISALFERRGARVLRAAAMHTVPLPEDGELVAATEAVLAAPVDHVVAITGVGFRGWLEAADQLGLGARLREHLRSAELVARGAKARGALRGGGLGDAAWTSPTEESREVLDHLLSRGVDGKRVVVQVHGEPMAEFRERLRRAGAEVLPVRVYRWTDPVDLPALDRLLDAVIAGEVDALTFTSAPAAANALGRADRTGRGEELRKSLRGSVFVACVGPVTAAPLVAADIPCALPDRSRTAALVRLVSEQLPRWRAAPGS